jgi:hypothetical protein
VNIVEKHTERVNGLKGYGGISMELKDSRYGNKNDLLLKDLTDEVVKCLLNKRNDKLLAVQRLIIGVLLQRVDECEEALNYPAGRTKRFFED